MESEKKVLCIDYKESDWVRDERARQVGVRDWSFWVHSLMAGEAPAPTRLHRQSHSSRPMSVLFPITKLHTYNTAHSQTPLAIIPNFLLSLLFQWYFDGSLSFFLFQKFNLWLKVNVHYSVICVVLIFLELYSLYGCTGQIDKVYAVKNDFIYFQNQFISDSPCVPS